jgi:uncharacterized protein
LTTPGALPARPLADRRKAWLLAALPAWIGAYLVLEPFSTGITHGVLGLDLGSRLGSAVAFFLLDVPKILLLLVGMVFVVTLIQSYFSPERSRALLSGRREGLGNLMAAALGVVTPFCSCSAVPLFIGFVRAGVPMGITFSFLIATPTVNEVALVMLLGLFGWRIAGLYLLSGLVIAIAAGWVIGRLGPERFVEPFVWGVQPGAAGQPQKLTWGDRVDLGVRAVGEIVGRVWPFVIAGIAIGAGIHGYVPTDSLSSLLGRGSWWSVPAAVVIGIPLYSNAVGLIPLVSALIEKGVAMGTALAFMMSVVGLSLPEVVILRRILRPALLGAFVGVVALAIVATGYLFNLLI